MTPFLEHEKTWSHLKKLFHQGRLPHAMLFCGPEGVGKKLVAQALAERILDCEGKVLKEHPDLTEIEPTGSSIKIDQIRELKASLPFAPFKAKARVILLHEAHLMRTGAANALLKSLEEPPQNNYFILISHAEGLIPSTIRSRTQIFRFGPLSEETLKKILQRLGTSLPDSMLPWAQGSVSLAQTIAEAQDLVPALRSLFPSREAIHFAQAHALSQEVSESSQVRPFLKTLLLALHQVLTHQRKNQKYDFDLLHFADRILALEQGLRQNINPKMNLTRLLMHFQEPQASRL